MATDTVLARKLEDGDILIVLPSCHVEILDESECARLVLAVSLLLGSGTVLDCGGKEKHGPQEALD